MKVQIVEIDHIKDRKGKVIDKLCKVNNHGCQHEKKTNCFGCAVYYGNPKLDVLYVRA